MPHAPAHAQLIQPKYTHQIEGLHYCSRCGSTVLAPTAQLHSTGCGCPVLCCAVPCSGFHCCAQTTEVCGYKDNVNRMWHVWECFSWLPSLLLLLLQHIKHTLSNLQPWLSRAFKHLYVKLPGSPSIQHPSGSIAGPSSSTVARMASAAARRTAQSLEARQPMRPLPLLDWVFAAAES